MDRAVSTVGVVTDMACECRRTLLTLSAEYLGKEMNIAITMDTVLRYSPFYGAINLPAAHR